MGPESGSVRSTKYQTSRPHEFVVAELLGEALADLGARLAGELGVERTRGGRLERERDEHDDPAPGVAGIDAPGRDDVHEFVIARGREQVDPEGHRHRHAADFVAGHAGEVRGDLVDLVGCDELEHVVSGHVGGIPAEESAGAAPGIEQPTVRADDQHGGAHHVEDRLSGDRVRLHHPVLRHRSAGP